MPNYGQSPILVLRRRQLGQYQRTDTSAFSRLTAPPKLPTLVIPGSVTIRTAEQVAKGLGLPFESEQALSAKVSEWAASGNPISYAQAVVSGSKAIFPDDPARRNELFSRCKAFWKTLEESKPYQPKPGETVIQKSRQPEGSGWTPICDGAFKRDVPGGSEIWMAPAPERVELHPDLAQLLSPMREGRGDPPELVFMAEETGDLLEKGATHKYIKRIPTGKFTKTGKVRYRYIYKLPGRRGLVSEDKLVTGTKLKVKHAGQEGHFEVLDHDKEKQIVHVRHDESKRTVHIREHDLHRMLESYHRQRTETAGQKAKAQAAEKPAPKPKSGEKASKAPKAEPKPKGTAPALPKVGMGELAKGEWTDIEGFAADPTELEEQAHAAGKGKQWAVIQQPNGYVLVSRAEKPEGTAKGPLEGDDTKVYLRDNTGEGMAEMPAKWVLMEADDVIASHKADTFAPHEQYPQGVQERDRARQDLKLQVDRIARQIKPAMVANTNPDAVNGAPIITEKGVVLGGNGRTMGMQRAYKLYSESGQALKEHLAATARTYGFTAADVRAMKNPVLLRKVKTSGDEKELHKLGRRMNESLTQGLDPREEEVSLGKAYVNKDVLSTLTNTIGEDQTLGSYLSSKDSKDLVAALERSGIIDDYNRAQYVNKETGLLNEEGRGRVERVLAARILPDAGVLDRMLPSHRANLARATSSFIAAEEHGWDIRPSLMRAVKAEIDMRQRDYTGRGALKRYLANEEIEAAGESPEGAVKKDEVALALLQILRDRGEQSKELPARFRGFALRARQSAHDAGGFQIPGFTEPQQTPLEALKKEFELEKPAKEQQELAASRHEEPDLVKGAAKLPQSSREAPADIPRTSRKTPTDRPQNARAKGSIPNAKPDNSGAEGGEKTGKDAAQSGQSPRPNRLMNRVIWLVQDLVEAAVHHHTGAGGPVKIDGKRIAETVMKDVKHAFLTDQELAYDFGRHPITPEIIQGLVQTFATMQGQKLAKARANYQDLMKAAQLALFGAPAKPGQPKLVLRTSTPAAPKPPAGYVPVQNSKHGGYVKVVGNKRIYWYPQVGQVSHPHPNEPAEVHAAHAAAEAREAWGQHTDTGQSTTPVLTSGQEEHHAEEAATAEQRTEGGGGGPRLLVTTGGGPGGGGAGHAGAEGAEGQAEARAEVAPSEQPKKLWRYGDPVEPPAATEQTPQSPPVEEQAKVLPDPAPEIVDPRPPAEKKVAETRHEEFLPELTYHLPENITRFPHPTEHIKELYPHQQEGAERIVQAWQERDGFQLLDDAGLGKLQPVDTPVLTPSGWRRIGDLRIGDKVISSSGKAAPVTDVKPQGVKPIYRVTFSDGSSTEAGPEHLWTVAYWAGGRRLQEITVTTDRLRTREPLDMVWPDGRRTKLSLAGVRLHLPLLAAPAEFDDPGQLPVDPYLLGALIANGALGGGSASLTVNAHDWEEVQGRIAQVADVGTPHAYPGCVRATIRGVIGRVRELGLGVESGAKYIPRLYLSASVQDRIALLHGLMDGDGSVSATRNRLIYHTTSEWLAKDVQELVEGLGGIASIRTYDRSDEDKSTEYQVRLRLPVSVAPFTVSRKASRYQPGRHAMPSRSVVSVEYTRDSEAVCIAVDAPDQLYATEHAILTHNTNTALAAMVARGGKRNLIVVPTSGKAGLKQQWSSANCAGLYGIQVKTVAELEEDPWAEGTFIVSYDELVHTQKVEGKKKPVAVDNPAIHNPWDTIIFDESHNMQQREGLRAEAGKRLGAKAGKVLYMSATPVTDFEHLHYLTRLGLGFDESTESFSRWAKEAGADVEENVVRNPRSRLPMAAIAATMMVDGMSLKRTATLDGLTAGFKLYGHQDLTPEQRGAFDTADRVIKMAGDAVGKGILSALYTGWAKQYWETLKIDKAVAIGKQALAEGKQVAFFTSYKASNHEHLRAIPRMLEKRAERVASSDKPGAEAQAMQLQHLAADIRGVLEELPPGTSVVKTLTEAFGGPKAVAEIHGATSKKPEAEQNEYQAGKKHVCVATMARGGTGISLHDTTGERPRVQINLSIPWSGREFNQVAGRSHRLGSKSETEMHWLLGDDPNEKHNGAVVARRLKDMGSLTVGDPEETISAKDLADWEFGNNKVTDTDDAEADVQALEEAEEAAGTGEEPNSEAAQVRDYFREFAEARKGGRNVIREVYQEQQKAKAARDLREARRSAEQIRQKKGWTISHRPELGGWLLRWYGIPTDLNRYITGKHVGGKKSGSLQGFIIPDAGMPELSRKVEAHTIKVDLRELEQQEKERDAAIEARRKHHVSRANELRGLAQLAPNEIHRYWLETAADKHAAAAHEISTHLGAHDLSHRQAEDFEQRSDDLHRAIAAVGGKASQPPPPAPTVTPAPAAPDIVGHKAKLALGVKGISIRELPGSAGTTVYLFTGNTFKYKDDIKRVVGGGGFTREPAPGWKVRPDQLAKVMRNITGSDDWQKARKLIFDLVKAEQMGLFGGQGRPSSQTSASTRPPGSGWEAIPAGKHGGFRRRKGAGWEYWYPGKGLQTHPHADDHPPATPQPKKISIVRVNPDTGKEEPITPKPAPKPEAPKPAEPKPQQTTIAKPAEEEWGWKRRAREAAGAEKPAPEPPAPKPAPKPAPEAPKPTPKPAEPKLVLKPQELDKPESTRRFETAGKKIGGSRADLAAMSMADLEKNPTLARSLVTKANVFGTWKPAHAEADRAAGVEPIASWAKKEIFDSIAGKPYDDPNARDIYRQAAPRVLDGLARCKTLGDIRDFLSEWQDLAKGRKLGTERVKLDAGAKYAFDWDAEGRRAWGGKVGDFEFRHWLQEGNKGTLADHYRAYRMTENSPSSRRDLLEAGGLAGWRENADGTVSPLHKTDDKQKATYLAYSGVLGSRFADLVGVAVRMRRGQKVLGYYEDWSGREKPSPGRREFDKKLETFQFEHRGEGADHWDWATKEAPTEKKAKPEVKTLEKSDTKWVWTRKTDPVGRKGPTVEPPKDSVAFMKAFGLPGVEYGNWANDAEREYHVTGAHEALHDLAEVLGIPPTKIGINNRLSMAFGARGSGGLRAPVAHYEPGRQVINITKIHGAGSLAHEWGHFLDHAIVLAHDRSGKGRVAHLSDGGIREVPREISDAMVKVMKTIKYQERTPEEKAARMRRRDEIDKRLAELKPQIDRAGKNIRWETRQLSDEEVEQIWQDMQSNKDTLVDNPPPGGWKKEDIRRTHHGPVQDENFRQHRAMTKEYNELVHEWRSLRSGADDTPHYAAAKALAGGNYYCNDHELFARAFESFIEDELTAKGRKSGYLVQHTRGQKFDDLFFPEGVYMLADSDHRKQTNQAIREFLDVLHKADQFSKAMATGLRLTIGG